MRTWDQRLHQSLGSLPHLACQQIWQWETWEQELQKEIKTIIKNYNDKTPRYLQPCSKTIVIKVLLEEVFF